LGGLVGGIGGGVLGNTARCEESPNPDGVIFSCAGVRGVLTTLGAVTGIILGGAIGVAVASGERWEPVPLPLEVGYSPHGGARVALRFEFGK